jgi:hypothetical protein
VMLEPLGFGRRAAPVEADDDCGGAHLLCVNPRWSVVPVGATCGVCRTH